MGARVVCAALLAVSFPAGAGAQTRTMTEAEALAQLTADSPRALSLAAATDAVRADVMAAGRWPNPHVTYNRESASGIAEHMLTVSQVLPVTGRRQLAVDAAAARVEASLSRGGEQLRRLRAELRLAFTSLYAAQTRERELARGGERLRALAEVLERREMAGEAAGFDRLRADREVIDVEADRVTAATARTRAQADLVAYLSGDQGAAVEALVEPRPRAELPPLDALMARAEATRGGLMALRQELSAAELSEQSAARARIPEPELILGAKTSNVGTGDTGGIFSVRVAVPLFDQAAPERAAARARAAQARFEAETFRRTLQAQVAAWRAAVVERRAMADRYRAATAGADQIERIAQVSYEAGERGILELLDAYRTTAAARVRQADLDAAVREAEIELEFVSGWEMP